MVREWTRKELSAVACSPFASLLGNPGATHWRAFEEAAGCLPGEEQPAALVRRTGGQKGHIVQYAYVEPRRKPSTGPAEASAAEGRKRRRVAPSAPPAEGGRRQSPRPTSPPARRGNGNPTRPYMAASSDKKITQLVAMGFTEAQVSPRSLNVCSPPLLNACSLLAGGGGFAADGGQLRPDP